MHRLTFVLRVRVGIGTSSDDIRFVREVDLPFVPFKGLKVTERTGPAPTDFTELNVKDLYYFTSPSWLGHEGFVCWMEDESATHVRREGRKAAVQESIEHYLNTGWRRWEQ